MDGEQMMVSVGCIFEQEIDFRLDLVKTRFAVLVKEVSSESEYLFLLNSVGQSGLGGCVKGRGEGICSTGTRQNHNRKGN